jgi:hypothetical protein
MNWRSGEVESERGSTVEASVGFIGTGVGGGTGLAWRGMVRRAEHRGMLWRCQGASNTRPFPSFRVLTPTEQPNVRISP